MLNFTFWSSRHMPWVHSKCVRFLASKLLKCKFNMTNSSANISFYLEKRTNALLKSARFVIDQQFQNASILYLKKENFDFETEQFFCTTCPDLPCRPIREQLVRFFQFWANNVNADLYLHLTFYLLLFILFIYLLPFCACVLLTVVGRKGSQHLARATALSVWVCK